MCLRSGIRRSFRKIWRGDAEAAKGAIDRSPEGETAGVGGGGLSGDGAGNFQGGVAIGTGAVCGGASATGDCGS